MGYFVVWFIIGHFWSERFPFSFQRGEGGGGGGGGCLLTISLPESIMETHNVVLTFESVGKI